MTAATPDSPLKSWFDSLRSGRGPCCSDADGSVVADVDWESKDGHYRVRLDGEWIDVPEDAVDHRAKPRAAGRWCGRSKDEWDFDPLLSAREHDVATIRPGSFGKANLPPGTPTHGVTIRHWTALIRRANHRKTRGYSRQSMG